MATKSIEWWRGTANHMWRTYFALIRDNADPHTMSETNLKIFTACDQIFSSQFVQTDQDILRTYFTSRWGDDLYAVEDYSLRNNVPTKVIWIVIRRANRLVMEHVGLLEKKDEKGG